MGITPRTTRPEGAAAERGRCQVAECRSGGVRGLGMLAVAAGLVCAAEPAAGAVSRGSADVHGGGHHSHVSSIGGRVITRGGLAGRNSVTVNSPASVHGIQITDNANQGGNNNTQNMLCGPRWRHCHMKETLIVP